MSLETLEVTEGTTGTYQVKLATEPGADVTVTPASGDPDVATVSPAKLTFTTSNWSTAQTVTVTAEEDDDYDNETATITHTAASADTGYNGITVGSVAVDVIDNEHAPITLTSNRTSVSEPSGTATITASVPSGYAPEADLTITLTHSGTAGHGASSDYTVGALTIPANRTEGTATLTVRDDSIDEDEETITLTGNATGYQGSDALPIALEDDGDTAGIVVSTASLDVDEGSTGQFQVKLNSEPLNNVTVGIAETSDPNNAISVSDASLTFTSSNWSTYQTVTVTGVEDDNDYADEEATITASASSSDAKYNTTSLNQTVSVSVKDNDPPPVTLSSSRTSVSEPSGTDTITASVPSGYAPQTDLRITLAHTGTAKHGSSADYTVGTLTIPANRTEGTVTLTVKDDSIDEDEETITLTGSAAGYADSATLSLALEDDDTARLVVSAASLDVDEGRTGQFQVKLGTEPLNNVAVGIAEASAAISVSDTSLTFTSSNWSTYQTVTVTGVEDDNNFADAEATITVSASSSDGKYNTTSLNQTVDVDVEDNDEAQISLTSSETSVSEASGSRTATIKAMVPATAEPGSDLTIRLAHTGTARHGSSADYAVGTLTITAGRRSGTATLAVRDDRIDEGSSETITMTGSASGYRASSALSIPLNDDDTARLVVSTSSLTIDESKSKNYTVKLNSQPTATVTVDVDETSSKISVSPTSLTFTTSNWGNNQTVTVTAAVDNSDYDDESATITNSASSSDSKYNTTSLDRTVDVDVDDDDTPPLTLSCPSSVSEPSGTGMITVSRPRGYRPSGSTAVSLSTSGSAAKGTDYTLDSMSLTIPGGQESGSTTLRVMDDDIDEDAKTINLRASATGYNPGSCTITLNDNDTAGLVVSPSSLDINENGSGQLRVKLNSQPTATVSVRVSENSSKISVSTTLTFTTSNWHTYQTATVRGSSDSDCGNEEATIILSASSSDRKYQGLEKEIDVDVDDDDSPTITLSSSSSSVSEPSGTATITATLGCAPSSNKTIRLIHSGTADEGDDYTVGTLMVKKDNTTGTATLSVTNDRIDEDAETIKLKGRTSSYTDSAVLSIALNDNDTARLVVSTSSLTIDESKSKNFTVKLNSQPTATVTVDVDETSSKISVSPTSLTFTTSNWGANQTVTVTGSSDNDCGNEDAQITLRPSSGDAKYNTTSLNRTVDVHVDDDETPTITLSSNRTSVSEPSGAATITATLGCAPSSDKTIRLIHSGTADEGDDYTVGTLEVAEGDFAGTAMLSVQDDNVCEGTETIKLKGRTSSYTDSAVLSINLNDNDTAGIVVSPTSLTIDEGKSKGYTVKLNSQPTARVTVGVSETSSDISLSSTSLTFTTSNWGANQTVTVTAAEDNSDYSNESATITHRPSSSDSKYNTTSLNKTVSVSVTDNDTPPPSISSISPPLQPPDTEVTISGSNFGSSQGSVSFGSDSVTDFSSWSNTSIRCFIPAYASAGTVPVKVTTSDGRMSGGYNYTITGQSPFSRGECGEEDDCPAEEKPKKDDSGSEEGGGSEEADDPPGDGG